MNDYLTTETAQRIQDSTRLKDLSKRRYTAALALLKPHLKGYNISDAITFDVMEKTLKAIATEAPRQRIHGPYGVIELHRRPASPGGCYPR